MIKLTTIPNTNRKICEKEDYRTDKKIVFVPCKNEGTETCIACNVFDGSSKNKLKFRR